MNEHVIAILREQLFRLGAQEREAKREVHNLGVLLEGQQKKAEVARETIDEIEATIRSLGEA